MSVQISCKVACPACSAKYTIVASKVAGKTVKIRCKKCETVIVVDGTDLIASNDSPSHEATEDQKVLIVRQLLEAGADAINLLDLDTDAAQRIIDGIGKLKPRLRKTLADVFQEFSEKPKDIEWDFDRLKPVEEQAAILHEYFHLDVSHVAEQVKRYGADQRLVVIPKFSAFVEPDKNLSVKQAAWPEFNRAMKFLLLVFDIRQTVCRIAINADLGFRDHSGGRIGPDHLHLKASVSEYYAKLEAETPGDVLIIPFQANYRSHDGTIETGLDAFAVGIMLFVHMLLGQNLHWGDVVCAGSKFTPDVTTMSWHGGLRSCGSDGTTLWRRLELVWVGIDHAQMWALPENSGTEKEEEPDH